MKRSLSRFFAIFVLLISVFLVVPQTVASTGWSKTYLGEPLDILTPVSLVQASDHGYLIVISAQARRVDNIGYQGHFSEHYELQLLKITSSGDVQWRLNYTQIDDPNHETPFVPAGYAAYRIVQTTDQGYAIASTGRGTFWMFKVNSQGGVLWSRIYFLNDEELVGNGYLYSMIQTGDGGFALAGSVDTSETGKDFWLVKTDSEGKAQWNQTYNSGTYTTTLGDVNPRDDEARCLVQTRDGGYALAGSSSLFRASTESVVFASWMVKTDARGKQLWNKGYDAPNIPDKYQIAQTADGGYAILGNLNEDFYLFKIDSAGQPQWSKTYGDRRAGTPYELLQLNDGGFAVAGTWLKVNSTATVSAMGLLRLDSSGQTSWIKTYNAKETSSFPYVSSDQVSSMILTSDGSYAIVGSTQFDSEYHQDVFFVKTETLEQPPPQPTIAPTQSTPQPTITSTPTQSSPSTSSSAQPTPAQSSASTSSPSNSPTQQSTIEPDSSIVPSPSIPELSHFTVMIIVVLATTILIVALMVKSERFKNQNSKASEFREWSRPLLLTALPLPCVGKSLLSLPF